MVTSKRGRVVTGGALEINSAPRGIGPEKADTLAKLEAWDLKTVWRSRSSDDRWKGHLR